MSTMTPSQFEQALFRYTVEAGMNCEYHQRMESKNGKIDVVIKILTTLSSFFSCIFGIAVFATESAWPIWLAATSSVLTTAFAISVVILPYSERQRDHLSLFRLWSDLLEDCKSLEIESTNADEKLIKQIKPQLQRINQRSGRLSASEKFPDVKILNECYENEIQRQNDDDRPQAA